MNAVTLHALGLGLLALSSQAQGTVWVVDSAAGPGFDFTNIQPAVDAAADGDTVLVRAGAYSGFTASSRSLSVVADTLPTGSSIAISGQIRVQFLAANQEFTLRGCDVSGPGGTYEAWLLVDGCTGSVWIENCTFSSDSLTSGTQRAVLARNSEAITFQGCTMTGSSPFGSFFGGAPGPGGEGLTVDSSNVSIFNSIVTGGSGSSAMDWSNPSYPGGTGMVVLNGSGAPRTIWLSGCSVSGGSGGFGAFILGICLNPEGGGDGLWMTGSAVGTSLFYLETSFAGGSGGRPDNTYCGGSSGPNGRAVRQGGGSVQAVDGIAHRTIIDSPVREGGLIHVDLTGNAGELALLLYSRSHTPIPLLAYSGTLLTGLPVFVLTVGTIPASGSLSLDVPLGDLGPGIEALGFFTQGAFIDPLGSASLGAGSAATLLDAGV